MGLWLCAAWAGAQTDAQTAEYIQRLNKYYYCLSREGLKSFQCDATATFSGQLPPGFRNDWKDFDWQKSQTRYVFSYLGGEVLPILASASDGGDPQATPAKLRNTVNLVNLLLLSWGAFETMPFYDPNNKSHVITIDLGPNSSFSLVSRSKGSTITVDYDNQALAKRLVVQKGR